MAGTSGRSTTHKAGRAEPMSEGKVPAQSVAQAGSTGQAAGVGSAVGVLRSSKEVPVMGMERRRDAGLDGRSGRGRRLRKEISLYDEKSPTMSVVALVNGAMEPDSESRIREIRSSGLMRGEVEPRNRQLRSVQPARSTSPTLPMRAGSRPSHIVPPLCRRTISLVIAPRQATLS